MNKMLNFKANKLNLYFSLIQLCSIHFYKDLGIIFDNSHLFKHIDYIYKKSYFSLNLIFRFITTKSPTLILYL